MKPSDNAESVQRLRDLAVAVLEDAKAQDLQVFIHILDQGFKGFEARIVLQGFATQS